MSLGYFNILILRTKTKPIGECKVESSFKNKENQVKDVRQFVVI
jgi:hypothetical protein